MEKDHMAKLGTDNMGNIRMKVKLMRGIDSMISGSHSPW
jgi:hypothetical protein